MTTYTIKLKGWLFTKTIKKVKAHFTPTDMSKNSLMIVLENEEKILIPDLQKFKWLHYSEGWFKMEQQNIKQESQGQASI